MLSLSGLLSGFNYETDLLYCILMLQKYIIGYERRILNNFSK